MICLTIGCFLQLDSNFRFAHSDLFNFLSFDIEDSKRWNLEKHARNTNIGLKS